MQRASVRVPWGFQFWAKNLLLQCVPPNPRFETSPRRYDDHEPRWGTRPARTMHGTVTIGFAEVTASTKWRCDYLISDSKAVTSTIPSRTRTTFPLKYLEDKLSGLEWWPKIYVDRWTPTAYVAFYCAAVVSDHAGCDSVGSVKTWFDGFWHYLQYQRALHPSNQCCICVELSTNCSTLSWRLVWAIHSNWGNWWVYARTLCSYTCQIGPPLTYMWD